MAIYRYPNLCTIYKSVINGRVGEGRPTVRACYGDSLFYCSRVQNEAKYTIVLIKNQSFVEENKNNYCWMTEHQLSNYLRRISSIKPFKYKVYSGEFTKTPCFKIDLAITGTRKEITFVLQCIKRTYEWPYNFFLQQAYEMQKLPAFKFDSILNLFNVAFSTFLTYPNTDHCFSGSTKFQKYSTLRELLPQISSVVQLYPDGCKTKIVEKLPGINYHSMVPSDTSQWNEDLFQKLLPAYIENYKILKR